MSEEPRRSVRSTKGYHSHKEQEIEGNIEPPKKKGGGKKTASSKKAATSQEPSPALETNEDGDIIRCVCGATSQEDDDDGEEWIACEDCGTWQHNVCMGIPTENVRALPDYFCEACRPNQHQELLAAMQRGESLWETRREAYVAEKKARKTRKGKGGGAKKKKAESKQRTNGQAKNSPVPSAREDSASAKKESVNRVASVKRKDREGSQEAESGKTKQRKVSNAAPPSPVATANPAPSSKTQTHPVPAASHSDQHVPQTAAPVGPPTTIGDLKDPFREKLAKFIYHRMEEAVKTAAGSGHFLSTANSSIEEKAQQLTLELEQAVHNAHFHDKTAYSNQAKTLGNNIKINPELCEKLLSKELSVDQLAVMSSDDLKSSKQRMLDEEELARAERQSIMVKEEGPRVRRTHKGEELVDVGYGVGSEVPSREQRDPNARMAGRSLENSPDELIEPPPDVDHTPHPRKPLNIDTDAAGHERKPSIQASEFDYNKVASKLPTPTHAQPIRRASGPVPVLKEAVDDPDVDRLLDDVPESPPYSPKEDTDPAVIWTGKVTMNSIAEFEASAKHVAGVELNEHQMYYTDLLGRVLNVTGRIEPEKADEYLCSLRWSPGSDMIVVSTHPRGEVATEAFTKVFNYFKEKNRYGVIGNRRGPTAVRDIYYVPVEAGEGPIPVFLSNLLENKLPDNRRERTILVVVVYRDEKHYSDTTLASQAVMSHPQRQVSQVPGPAMSPIAHQGHFKPLTDPGQLQMEERQREGERLARDILGDLVHSPTVAFILPQAHQMVAREWNVIKEIFESDVKSRTDLQHLGQLLAAKANPQADSQQANPGVPPAVRT